MQLEKGIGIVQHIGEGIYLAGSVPTQEVHRTLAYLTWCHPRGFSLTTDFLNASTDIKFRPLVQDRQRDFVDRAWGEWIQSRSFLVWYRRTWFEAGGSQAFTDAPLLVSNRSVSDNMATCRRER